MAEILIIEENEDERSHLQRHLDDNVYLTDAVATLAEGLALMEQAATNGQPYKLICLGEQLRAAPTERGLNALQQLRNAKGYGHTRILGGSMSPNYWYGWNNDLKFVAVPKLDANPSPRMVWDIPAVIQHIRGDLMPTRYNLNTAA